MNLDVRTPEKLLFSGPVTEVYLTASDGQIGILPNHADLATILSPGWVRYRTDKGEQIKLDSPAGFALVKNNQVDILLRSN